MTKKHSIEYVQSIAQDRNGKCLSIEYRNAHTKMEWECSERHKWKATFHSVKNRKTWCKICSGKEPHTLEKMQQIAKQRGGKCLSIEYQNAHTKMEWECSEGHQWWAKANSIYQQNGEKGSWCLECAGNKPLTLEKMKKFAADKGGKCISEEYKNVDAALEWMCGDGHVFKRTYGSMKQNGTFCTVCSSNFSEEQCRSVFEQLTGSSFPTKRPAWLMGAHGKPLELDGYNEALKIAFEYNGKQHFSENTSWPSSEQNLQKIQSRDALKVRLCRENNVALFQINYDDDPELIPDIILNQYYELKANPKLFDFSVKIDLSTVQGNIWRLNEMREIAKKRGGKCLSKVYKTRKQQLKWQCKCGYIWWASPSNVKHQETRCPKCAKNLRLTIDDLKQFARKKKGKCLSKKIENSQDHLLWECNKGHQWNARASVVHAGISWCPECHGGVRLSMDEMHSMAAKFGGKCLSTHYQNVHTDLTWECKNGHRFKQKPRNIRRYDKWCDKCTNQ